MLKTLKNKYTCITALCGEILTVYCLSGSRGDFVEVDDSKTSKLAESLTSHQYKSYIVNMIHKIRTKTEVQLGKFSIVLIYE